MSKGLPWIRLSTSIAMDGDLEFVSDAAFRTYVELISLAGHYLTDGRVPLRIVKKQCNTADVDAALGELQEAGFVAIEDEDAFVPTYLKWQETAEQVQARRDKTAERVRQHRHSDNTADSNGNSNGVTDGVSNAPQSKSKSKSKDFLTGDGEPPPSEEEDTLTAQTVVAFAVDHARELGADLTDGVKGHLAKEVGKQFKAGADPLLIRAAVGELIERNKDPSKLSYVMRDLKGGGRVGAHSGRSQNGEW